ncbi:MAG: spondin domain-containing protein [Pseudomonadota bacterium]
MKRQATLLLCAIASTLLVACSDSNNDNNTVTDPVVPPTTDAQFDVSVTNLTFAQPFSPVAVMLHRSGFNSFVDGQSASTEIERLAEGGDNSSLLATAQATPAHIASVSTAGPVPPQSRSATLTLDVPVADLSDLRLSVVSMLVHTNDGITGTNAFDLSNMSVGDSRSISGPTWDSGTEANTETGATLPGPDFGGEGFNPVRDDLIDSVRIHAGVVTSASATFGLPSSNLVERHRFLNPTSRIVVTRVR